MTKLKLKVWIALLAYAYEMSVAKTNNPHLAQHIRSVKKECEIKLLEEYRNE